jgi:enamine deaminase RidA (YjgF/YER057c/UK114 family)
MFLTDISLIDEVGTAHGEVFRDIRPASTALQISALINPEMLVEIEVTAILPESLP